MRKNLVALFLVLAFVATGAMVTGTANADVTYNYVGTPYAIIQDSSLGTNMTASVTFDSAVVTNNFTGAVGGRFTPSGTGGGIVSWSITSGSVTYATGGSAPALTDLFTFQNGVLTQWIFQVGTGSTYSFQSSYNQLPSSPPVFSGYDSIINYTNYPNSSPYNSTGELINASGTWTLGSPPNPAPVPLPASLLLFGPGLAGLAVIRRRLKI